MSSVPLLTAVIPVTKMNGKLDKFKSTISDCKKLGVGLVVVHDKRDLQTGIELLSLLRDFGPTNFEYIENEFGSAGAARNAGLKMCKSDWITFWDSDDHVFVAEFLNMIKSAVINDSEIAIGKISVQSSEKNSIAVESPSLVSGKNLDLQISIFPAFTRMGFKKQILGKDPFPEIPIGEDLIFLLKVNPVRRKITIKNDIVYCYRIGGDNQATKKHTDASTYLLLLTKMGLFLSQSGKKDKRLILAFTNKLLMSLTRKALRGKVSGEGFAFMLKIALYNLKSPVQAVQIVLYFLCNRPKVIGAIHGK